MSLKRTGFNPRVLPRGRDYCTDELHAMFAVSIHASSREDATYEIRDLGEDHEFQSTRPPARTRPGRITHFEC